MTDRFITRTPIRGAGKAIYATRDNIEAAYPEKVRVVGRVGDLFNRVEGTGVYLRDRLNIGTRRLTFPQVAATAAGVKSVIRRLRDREAEELAAADAKLAEAYAALERAKADREAVLATAWKNGNVVRLQEVKAIADAGLAKLTGRTLGVVGEDEVAS